MRLTFEDRQWLWERYGTAYRVLMGIIVRPHHFRPKLEIERNIYLRAVGVC